MNKLRQLVDLGAAEEVTKSRNTLVVARRDSGEDSRTKPHCPQLEKNEGPTVTPDTLLTKQPRYSGVQPTSQSCHWDQPAYKKQNAG